MRCCSIAARISGIVVSITLNGCPAAGTARRICAASRIPAAAKIRKAMTDRGTVNLSRGEILTRDDHLRAPDVKILVRGEMLTRGDHAGAQRMKDRLSAIKSATTEVTVEKRDYGGHGSQNRFSNSFLRVLRS